MTPLSKVVSLKTAKRLLLADFPEEQTERHYLIWEDTDTWELTSKHIGDSSADFSFPAPDAQEIEDLLPININNTYQVLHIIRVSNGWMISFDDLRREQPPYWRISVVTENKSEALAEAWLRLKKENLL